LTHVAAISQWWTCRL